MDAFLECAFVFIMQLLLMLSRTYNMRAVAKHEKWKAVVWSGGVQITFLLGTCMSIKGILEGSWVVCIAFVLGGLLGTYLTFKE